jgi:glycerol-3-phosphate dehydrogenase
MAEAHRSGVEPSNDPSAVQHTDVLVIGAGVVGAAVARALSHLELDVTVVEAAADVGSGTSKANTAICHTGFDATPGTTEARLVRRGYELLVAYADSHGIALERTGALLVAWDADQLAALAGLHDKAVANGYEDCRRIEAGELYQLEPELGPGALGALSVPGEYLIDPWSVPLAFITEAVRNGTTLRRSWPVDRIETLETLETLDTNGTIDTIDTNDTNDTNSYPAGARYRVWSGDRSIEARFLVNAAGLHADELDHQLGHDTFDVTARRGQLIVYDKLTRPLVRHIILPVPSKMGKGVLVSPTVFGNVMVGPTAEELPDKADRSTTAEALGALVERGARIVPALANFDVTATYAGLRAATQHSDYCIARDGAAVTLGGIRSTGLTAALAIAEHTLELLREAGLHAEAKSSVVEMTMPNLGEAFPRPYERGGEIVCHCERVTRDEIIAARRSTIPPVDLDGLRRRTRALMGRCQGFYCYAELHRLMGNTGQTGTTGDGR